MRRIGSSGSARIISLDLPGILDALERAARRMVAEDDEVQAVYLIGSLARGDYTGFSDADVLIILHGGSLDPVQRIRKYLPYFDLPIGVDLLVYTAGEFAAMRRSKNPLIERMEGERRRLA